MNSMTARAPQLLDSSLLDFLESDVAILVASVDSANKPVITRGFGVRVSDDCTELTVFLTDKQSAEVLKNVTLTGRIALTVAKITSYESFQVKGQNAREVGLSLKDERYIASYLEGAKMEMTRVGVLPEHAAALFKSRETQKLVGVKFTVAAVYCQTPGPGAGEVREQSE